MAARRLAVVGGGWAGLAAAVEATRRGHVVTLFEMAPQLGGRAREVQVAGQPLDNGQHILIGAYTETLALIRSVGVDVDAALLRTPLRVTYPDGAGLRLNAGSPLFTFGVAVLRYPGWGWHEKHAMLRAAVVWASRRFRCDPSWTVDQLITHLPPKVRSELLEPLCVAALNTPASHASATVFLRVLHDALFSGPGSADLLLPRRSLTDLWPRPAAQWLEAGGATLRLATRVETLRATDGGWQVDGEHHDGVVLACTAQEASRLTASCAPGWSREAGALSYEPIVTVYLHSPGASLPEPMMALRADANHPTQFIFDLGRLRGMEGVFAAVISGAASWTARGRDTVIEATLHQVKSELGTHLGGTVVALHTATEKRATFLCTPALHRPVARILPMLWAAGDYVQGPYPATLEGAVRSGRLAALAFD